eukprot:NODE_3686_length_934_cov_40.635028_g3387_i0.p1 GENE.NODE_3686_length_934_cov_40.635028_g3387_i0~~NODE_3686_length_934_cov_40.635028_g3387_i0.p1  ORF type:complete len:238 (+),score=39.95 NODE_3686_length_934_cov_40.635028_g3387_i0:96-809(+)
MIASRILLRSPAPFAPRFRRSQWWKCTHYPTDVNRHHAVVENLMYSKIIDDLNSRFRLVGEAPTVQISKQGAFVFMRHWIERPTMEAVEALCSRGVGDIVPRAKPTLAEKLRMLDRDGARMDNLHPLRRLQRIHPSTRERRIQRREEQKTRLFQILKRMSTRAPSPHVPIVRGLGSWQHFYDTPLIPIEQEGKRKRKRKTSKSKATGAKLLESEPAGPGRDAAFPQNDGSSDESNLS